MGEVALTPEGHKMSFIVTMASTIAQELGVSPQAVTSTGVIILIGLHAMAAIPLYRWCFPGAGGPGMARAATVTFLIVAYSVCSSMLLILNKVAVTYIPAPSFILFCQLASCAVFVKAMSLARLVECEPLEYEKSKKFALIVFGFIGTLFANVTALKYVPVDTIICFRASTPIVIAVIEYFYLGRELPSLRSWGSLFGVFVGVAIYTAADIHFTVLGYAWIVIWYTFAVFENGMGEKGRGLHPAVHLVSNLLPEHSGRAPDAARVLGDWRAELGVQPIMGPHGLGCDRHVVRGWLGHELLLLRAAGRHFCDVLLRHRQRLQGLDYPWSTS
eukprot:jgi/Botrbrau1/22366/Bobra.0002s0043.1